MQRSTQASCCENVRDFRYADETSGRLRSWGSHTHSRPELPAGLHRGVEEAHPFRGCGGWDPGRVDDRCVGVGVREVLHAVVADALRELERRRLLLWGPLLTREPGWLHVLARGRGLLELFAVRVHR